MSRPCGRADVTYASRFGALPLSSDLFGFRRAATTPLMLLSDDHGRGDRDGDAINMFSQPALNVFHAPKQALSAG